MLTIGKTLLSKNDPYLNCLRFGIVGVAFYTAIILIPDRLYEPLNHVIALLTGFLLSLAGQAPIIQGTTVTLKDFRVEIITECSGLYLFMLFSAFVIAFPAQFKVKLTGIILGIPFLNLANIVRIALVTAIGAWRPSLFEYAHIYLMQVIMVIMVCVTCLTWLRWTTAVPTTRSTPLEFLARFIAIASVLFVFWLPIHREYVALLDQLVIYLFSLIDFKLFIPPRPEIYHHTLSLVVFTSLICASRDIGVRQKAYGLVAGLFLLVLAHLLLRVAHVLLTAMHMESVLPIFLTFLVINQYLLPVLLWLVAVQRRKISRGNATCTCPICGAEKVGMLHHISAVHGQKALDDPRVRFLLKET